jgi:hypothetical protein
MLDTILLQKNIQLALDSAIAPGGTSAILASKLAAAIHIYVSAAKVKAEVSVPTISVVTPDTVNGTGAGSGRIMSETSKLQ